MKRTGKYNIEIVRGFSVSQNNPGKLEFFNTQLGCEVTQADIRELLPYLLAFAETGELPQEDKKWIN